MTNDESAKRGHAHRRPSYILTGGNIVDHLHTQQELEHQTRSFFHFSPIWRAIQDHISCRVPSDHDMRNNVLVSIPSSIRSIINDDEYVGIKCFSEGYAVYFRDAAIYGLRGEAQNIEIQVEIEWEWNSETITRSHTIKVPVALCKEFSEKAFEAWISRLRQEKLKAKREEDAKTLKRLIKEYPALNANGFLDKINLPSED